MSAHTRQEFETFMSQLKTTIVDFDFFVDFDKCKRNVEQIEIDLNILNYLLGKSNLSEAVHTLWKNHKDAFQVLDILIAVRRKDKKSVAGIDGKPILLSDFLTSPDRVIEFLDKTGLSDIFISQRIKDLVDYVFGVEVGMDTNARKNRSGTLMENKVACIFEANDISFSAQVSSKSMPTLQDTLGTDVKHFDFMVKTRKKIYVIEVNFFSDNGGGTKLNEVARSFKGIAAEINKVEGFEFVWITDGTSWFAAENKLEEAYNNIPKLYNLTNIIDFIGIVKKEGQ